MKYELVAHYDANDVKATIWWDGHKIRADNTAYLSLLKKIVIHGKTYKDGLDFLKVLPFYYKNGYMSLRRIDA